MMNALKVWILRKYYKFTNKRVWKNHIPDIQWTDIQLGTEEGNAVQARRYEPASSSGNPVIVYFHGGGWVIGDLETHHPFCARLAKQTECQVISVDYRLAPEHPFPAAPNDCLTAIRAVAQDMEAYGPNSGKIILAGDSAGANLALCSALELIDHRDKLGGIISLYPVADHYSAGFETYPERVKGQILTDDLMGFFWDNYLKHTGHDSLEAKKTYPLRADNLAVLPRTLMVTAQYDPLRGEGKALTEKLEAAGVETMALHYDELHGFACGGGPSKSHIDLMKEIEKWIAV